MTWTRKSAREKVTRHPWQWRLRTPTKWQSVMRTKQDSLTCLEIRKTLRALRSPELPTDAVSMLHNMTHIPFRDAHSAWHVEQAVGRTDELWRKSRRTLYHSSRQTRSSYLLWPRAKHSQASPSWTRIGAVISFMCAWKGGYESVTRPFESLWCSQSSDVAM